MSNKKIILSLVVTSILGGLSIFWLSQDRLPESTQSGRIKIVASFYPLAYFASLVGGEFVSVQDLTMAGAEPHDFEPSLRELALMGDADLFIYNGASFEPWVEKWLRGEFMRPHAIIDMVAELITHNGALIEYQGSTDPHVWLDPLVAIKEVEIIRDALIRIDPAHQAEYRANATHATDRLKELHGHFTEGLASCALHDVVVSHEAFNYVAQRYGFSAMSIAGISPEEEPSPKELAEIVELARAKGINFIFFETMASPKFAETIAREIGGGILVLNPLESLTPDEVQSGEDYFSLMEKNLINLRTALGCE